MSIIVRARLAAAHGMRPSGHVIGTQPRILCLALLLASCADNRPADQTELTNVGDQINEAAAVM